MEPNGKQVLYHEQLSIGLGGMHHMRGQKKNYIGHNSIDYSQVNSLGYQFNAFNSNQILSGLFNINNSNTFLNIYENNMGNISNVNSNMMNMNNNTNNRQKQKPSVDPVHSQANNILQANHNSNSVRKTENINGPNIHINSNSNNTGFNAYANPESSNNLNKI